MTSTSASDSGRASGLSQSGVSNDFKLQMAGYGLATAEILYRMPDHPSVLQSYLWQEYDLCPKFPELHRFLEFWHREIEGRLHSVRVAHCALIKPAEMRAVDGVFVLH
ncbi:usg protein [Xanthobacter sp. V0B-10]|uniref:usg protein n=2 Tax=Xanthobacter albus TaxID=3119929 RepID=UPI00372ABE53